MFKKTISVAVALAFFHFILFHFILFYFILFLFLLAYLTEHLHVSVQAVNWTTQLLMTLPSAPPTVP